MSDPDDFYIGYEPRLPASLRRAVTVAVVLALAGAAASAAIFVAQQRGLAATRFDYADEQTFDGYLVETPAAALLVPGRSGLATYWLVAPGKHGPHAVLGRERAGWVTIRGKLIVRERWHMIEVSRDSIRRHARQPGPPAASVIAARAVVLRGEIVDGKCYLGVMNPGERTVHRDCAVRCISGGVPPMFAYHTDDGAQLAMLIGGDPRALHQQIGRPVTLSGFLSGPEESRVLDISRAQ